MTTPVIEMILPLAMNGSLAGCIPRRHGSPAGCPGTSNAGLNLRSPSGTENGYQLSPGHRVGPGRDFGDLAGDLGLAGFVEREGVVGGEIVGVVGGAAHRDHPGRVLGGYRFE